MRYNFAGIEDVEPTENYNTKQDTVKEKLDKLLFTPEIKESKHVTRAAFTSLWNVYQRLSSTQVVHRTVEQEGRQHWLSNMPNLFTMVVLITYSISAKCLR